MSARASLPPVLPLVRERLAGDITALRMKCAYAKAHALPVTLTLDEATHLAEQLETYSQVVAKVERLTSIRDSFLRGGGES